VLNKSQLIYQLYTVQRLSGLRTDEVNHRGTIREAASGASWCCDLMLLPADPIALLGLLNNHRNLAFFQNILYQSVHVWEV